MMASGHALPRRGADQAITRAIDTHVQTEQANNDGSAGMLGGLGGPEDQRGCEGDQGTGLSILALAWARTRGAGDENRTRTISLGTGLSCRH
jgi:hypothetical protein